MSSYAFNYSFNVTGNCNAVVEEIAENVGRLRERVEETTGSFALLFHDFYDFLEQFESVFSSLQFNCGCLYLHYSINKLNKRQQIFYYTPYTLLHNVKDTFSENLKNATNIRKGTVIPETQKQIREDAIFKLSNSLLNQSQRSEIKDRFAIFETERDVRENKFSWLTYAQPEINTINLCQNLIPIQKPNKKKAASGGRFVDSQNISPGQLFVTKDIESRLNVESTILKFIPTQKIQESIEYFVQQNIENQNEGCNVSNLDNNIKPKNQAKIKSKSSSILDSIRFITERETLLNTESEKQRLHKSARPERLIIEKLVENIIIQHSGNIDDQKIKNRLESIIIETLETLFKQEEYDNKFIL